MQQATNRGVIPQSNTNGVHLGKPHPTVFSLISKSGTLHDCVRLLHQDSSSRRFRTLNSANSASPYHNSSKGLEIMTASNNIKPYNPYQGSAASVAVPVHLSQQSTAEQPKRNVSFRPTVTVHPVEKLANNKEDRSRMYLSQEEMNQISIKNRAIQLSSKETHTSFEHGTVGLHVDSALRGPEVLLRPTQVSNRLFIRRTILKYQRKLNAKPTKSDEENFISLAALSTKLSQWSTLVALEAAKRTSDELILTNAHADTSPFPTTKRRRVACYNEDDHTAKQRRSNDYVL